MYDVEETRVHRSREVDSDDEYSPDVIVRVQYACYLFVGLLIAMLFRGATGTIFDSIGVLRKGCETVGGSAGRGICTGEVLIYRLSFALAMFYMVHFLSVSDLTCCVRSSVRAKLQTNFFLVKSVILVLFFFLTLMLPNSFFGAYAYLCLYASAGFLLMNVIFLVDFSYVWNDDWGDRSDANSKWMWYLLAICLGSYLLGVILCVAAYVQFVPHSSCRLNATAITIVLLGGLCLTVLSVWVPRGSVVPSSIVFLYCAAVTYFTLRTSSDERCNAMASSAGAVASVKQVLMMTIASCFMLCYSVVSSGGSGMALGIGVDEDGIEDDPDVTGHLSHYMFFYFVMMIGSMYLAMLATGWHVSGMGEKTLASSINVAFWIRMATVWLAMFLYGWSLLAPYVCCVDRDFGFDADDDW